MDKFLNSKENWENFRASALKTKKWIQKALELKSTIEIFRQYHIFQHLVISKEINLPPDLSKFYDKSHFTFQTQRMLMGYSFENLLKGILIFQNPEKYLPKDKNQFKIKGGHNLSKLCKDCNINLKIIEENYLKMLSFYSEWGGRYPIGSHEHHIPLEREPLLIKGVEVSMITLSFVNQDDNYFNKERWYDIYHTSITDLEYNFYEQIFQKFLKIAKEIKN